MTDRRPVAALIIALSLTACSSDQASTTTTTTPTTTAAPTTTVAPTTTTASTTTTSVATTTTTTPATTTTTTTTPATTTPATTTTTEPVLPAPVAVWPAADVVFDTPESAAADFIAQVFRVEPLLGEFRPGDTASGEIEVLSPLDDDDPSTTSPAGVTLLMRQFAPDGGWFVIGAVSDGVTITTPVTMAEVPPGPLEVTGVGRGFEGTVVVRALRPGAAGADCDADLDCVILITDWTTPVPYTATLDLSETEPGEVIALIARGDTGIAATGEFSAIPIIIAD